MSQNIYDNKEFFEKYKKLRENVDNYNNLVEQPTMDKPLLDLNNKIVLDLGCGYGNNCMGFIRRRAKKL